MAQFITGLMAKATINLILCLLISFAGFAQKGQFRAENFIAPNNAQANTYIAAIITAGITPTDAQKGGLQRFFTDGSSNVWLTRKVAAYLTVWNSANADAVNMITPGTYDISWGGGTINRSATLGLLTSGGTCSNCYGNTGLAPSFFPQDSISIFTKLQSVSTSSAYSVGTTDGTSKSALEPRATTAASGINLNSSTVTLVNKVSPYYIAGSRVNSTTQTLYMNGVGTSTSASSIAPTTQPFWILSLNNNGTAGGSNNTNGQQYQDIGYGMNSTLEAQHYVDVRALMKSFNVNSP